MARIRSVKPEFWTAEQVMELSRDARLLFIGVWNFCDDRGVHPASVKTLRAQVFPSDMLDLAEVERWVVELLNARLLETFEAEGRSWWYVTGWHHQVINRPSRSRYPAPPRGEDATDTEDAVSAPGWSGVEWTGVDESGRERKGKEGNREEGNREEGSGVDTAAHISGQLLRGTVTPFPSHAGAIHTLKGESGPYYLNTPNSDGASTRLEKLAVQLYALGIDAPVHLPVWSDLLARFDDAALIAAARVARTRKPGERVHLNYLVPMLNAGKRSVAGKPRRAKAGGGDEVTPGGGEPEQCEGAREYGAGGRL